MTELKVSQWEASYLRKENFIFYPKEEVVKFLNRFVRKRAGYSEFIDILKSKEKLKGLDFGCGIGRQTLLLNEFEIDAWGIDISENAIKTAEQLALNSLSHKNCKSVFIRLEDSVLPFDNDFFDIAISDSVLDSMYFDIAVIVLKELDRTVKQLLYISLIGADSNKNGSSTEKIVDTKHEAGTIQSYFDLPKIKMLIANTNWKIKWYNLIKEEVPQTGFYNSRYHIVLTK